MVASWEYKKQVNTLVAILHTEATTVNWALGLRKLIIPGPDPMLLCGMPYDHARNQAVSVFLQSNLEWLFFLDSDVICPRDAILRLQSHNQPLISGVYARRSPPEAIPVMLKDRQWLTSIPNRGLIEVHLVGAGCLLIHRSVLQAMPPQAPGKHWFHWKVDLQGVCPPEECLSEDFSFCYHARTRLGVKIMVDCSVVCKHIGNSESMPGYFRPLGSTEVA